MPDGLRAYMQTLPGVGLDQVTKMAGHLANAWGCIRVEVRQDRPGLLCLRGLLRDPLAAPWTCAGRGYSEGEALYEATIASDMAESRALARQVDEDAEL